MLDEKDVSALYDYLLDYEKCIKHQYGSYNVCDKTFTEFKDDNSLFLGSIKNKKDREKSQQYDNFILWKEGAVSRKQTKVDRAHALLRRIRNSFAHGNINEINKDGVAAFEIYDCDNKDGSVTLHGVIRQHLLYELIERIKNTKKDDV